MGKPNTEGERVLGVLCAIAEKAAELGPGWEWTGECPSAPPDLLLLLATQDDGVLRAVPITGDRVMDEAELRIGTVVFRAQRVFREEWERAPVKLTVVPDPPIT